MTDPVPLAALILQLVRALRRSGINIGSAAYLDAVRAVAVTGVDHRPTVEYALQTALIKRREDLDVFRLALRWFFDRVPAGDVGAIDDESGDRWRRASRPPGLQRLLESLRLSTRSSGQPTDADRDAAGTASELERLKNKDFAQMTVAEVEQAKRLMRTVAMWSLVVPTRRFRSGHSGNSVDVRRALQHAHRTGGELLRLPQRSRRRRPPDVVLLCDVSGSMASYSRLFLHFAHVLATGSPRVETFTFGTRLTRVTRALASKDVDAAMARCSTEVVDWDGGTRIGQAIRTFNRRWSRRVLTRKSLVVLLSDGLDRDPDETLSTEAARLHRQAWRLLWLNPLLRYGDFQPRASGIQRLLPHVDALLPGHNLRGLNAIADAIESAVSNPA